MRAFPYMSMVIPLRVGCKRLRPFCGVVLSEVPMFTGLVSAVGRVERVERAVDALRLFVVSPFGGLVLGESVAVSGVCLTAAELAQGSFGADLTRETLERT